MDCRISINHQSINGFSGCLMVTITLLFNHGVIVHGYVACTVERFTALDADLLFTKALGRSIRGSVLFFVGEKNPGWWDKWLEVTGKP